MVKNHPGDSTKGETAVLIPPSLRATVRCPNASPSRFISGKSSPTLLSLIHRVQAGERGGGGPLMIGPP